MKKIVFWTAVIFAGIQLIPVDRDNKPVSRQDNFVDIYKTPENIKEKPIIVGHEFCGEVIKVGKNWGNKYKENERYVVQANLQLPDAPWCPGYSYQYCGGDATYIILPADVMKQDCLLPYNG